MLDALRNDSINCDQGAALMAEKKAAVDRKITELKAVSRMLGAEQKRLLASAEAQRRSQACAG